MRVLLLAGAAAAALASCGPTRVLEEPIQGNALTRYLADNGYTTWTMPSTLQSAGVLIELDENGRNPIVKGDLLACAASTDARAELENAMFGSTEEDRNRYRNATWPNFELQRDTSLDLGLSAAVGAIGGTVGYDRIRKAKVTTSKAGPEKLFEYSIEGWFRNPANLNKLIDGCADAIASGRAILVTESAYIEDGQIEFFADDAATAKLDKPAILDAFKTTVSLDPAFENKITDDGKVIFEERIYIAYKTAKAIPSAGTLGSGDEWEDATALLQTALGDD
jgi:hypothetical protein